MSGSLPAALEVQRLVAAYEDVVVLREVELTVPAGSITVLFGPNGAGKTTLLKCIAGLVSPRTGAVCLEGSEITSLRAAERVRAGITYVPEGRAIFGGLTVRENLRLFGRLAGKKRDGSSSSESTGVEEAVTQFPRLKDRLRQTAGTLSGGEQQMLALSRVFFGDPRIIIIDEMSFGLAPVIVSELFKFVGELRQTGKAVLLTDQFVHQALKVADLVYVMQGGAIRFVADPSEPGLEDVIHRVYVGSSAELVRSSPP